MISTTDLVPELRTIADLFDEPGTTYTIPIYQRNFAWQATQIEQLIRDIQDAINGKDDGYFLGNLIVTRRKENTSDFEVIDGQQRLTTLHLLLTFLSLPGNGSTGAPTHQGRLRYESRPRATEALRRVAASVSQQAGPSIHAITDEDAGIHTGFNVIQQYMDQHISGASDRRNFAEFLRSNVTVVRASLPAKTDLNRYFEIMNTRGQQLQQVDIVKARLMSRLGDDMERACFAWIWDACADMESYVQMSLTRGNQELRTQIFGETWSWLTAKRFDDLQHVQRSNPGIQPGVDPFETASSGSLTLDEAFKKYAAAGTPIADEDDENVRFRSTVEFPTLLLHVLKIAKGIAEEEDEVEGHLDDKHLVERFEQFSKQSSRQQIGNFAFKLLQCRNIFDNLILKRQYTTTHSDDGDWSLKRFIRRGGTPGYVNTFPRNNVEVEEDNVDERTTNELLLIQSMLRVTFTSASTMHWITKLLRHVEEHEPSTLKEANLVELLRNYSRGKVRAAFFADDKPQPIGFSINRIVFTYLDYLLLIDEPNPGFTFSFRNSIEHFYPQHPDEEQSGPVVSEECLHLLGNLALVSVGANSKFSNSLPMTKALTFQTMIQKQSPKLQEMAEITRREGWGDEQVEAHHAKMIKRLTDDLGIGSAHSSGGRCWPG